MIGSNGIEWTLRPTPDRRITHYELVHLGSGRAGEVMVTFLGICAEAPRFYVYRVWWLEPGAIVPRVFRIPANSAQEAAFHVIRDDVKRWIEEDEREPSG